MSGIERLKGFEIAEIRGMEPNSGEVTFVMRDGREFIMNHDQDCCESVNLIDVVGDKDDLIGEIITEAEAVSRSGEAHYDYENAKYTGDKNWPEGVPEVMGDSSWTWTFYKLGTRKGSITLRWFGSSNGYYGEEVSFRLKGEHR